MEIGAIIRRLGMTWESLRRAIKEPPPPRPAGRNPDELLELVRRIERAQPWDDTSSAPQFMETLRELAETYGEVLLSERQEHWLGILLTRTEVWEREHQVPPLPPLRKAPSDNVVPLRPRVRDDDGGTLH